jgi:hypothetical protein
LFVAATGWLVNKRISISAAARSIVNVVLLLIVVGMALWLIDTYIPMAGAILALLNIVVVFACCVVVLRAAGLWGAVVKGWDNLTHRLRTEPASGPRH